MTISGLVVVTLLLFQSSVIQGNSDEVKIIDQLIRCNEQRYDYYDKAVDDVLKALDQRAGEHHGLGFNTYYTSSPYHGHACCHPNLIEQDCSRCIHDSLDQIRHRCGRRIGGFVSTKLRGGDYACEVRYEKYDMDGDYFSCSRY